MCFGRPRFRSGVSGLSWKLFGKSDDAQHVVCEQCNQHSISLWHRHFRIARMIPTCRVGRANMMAWWVFSRRIHFQTTQTAASTIGRWRRPTFTLRDFDPPYHESFPDRHLPGESTPSIFAKWIRFDFSEQWRSFLSECQDFSEIT